MSKYTHKIGSIKNYIQQIYVDGLKKSNYFSDIEIEELVSNIGLFKFKVICQHKIGHRNK